MQLIEVEEKCRISDEQARIQPSESDAREEEVLAWKHDVSFNGLAIDYCILLYYNYKLRWACFLVFILYLYSSIIYTKSFNLTFKFPGESIPQDTQVRVYMLWFNFILGLNFIFFCFWVR